MHPLRQLPAVGRLVAALDDRPRDLVVTEARELLAAVRAGAPAPDDWEAAIRERIDRRLAPVLRG